MPNKKSTVPNLPKIEVNQIDSRSTFDYQANNNKGSSSIFANLNQKAEVGQQLEKLGGQYDIDVEEFKGNGDVDPKQISAYIDQQMAIKLDTLRDDVFEMLDNMQLQALRQFQIQRGSVQTLLNEYMIDESSVLQEDVPIGAKYLYNNMSVENVEVESDGSGPDYIYL